MREALAHMETKLASSPFKELDRGDHVIFEYMYAYPGLFEGEFGEILRECRGSVFNKETGECTSRPYHKFFNYGEKKTHNPLNGPWVCMEKLDGSMVRVMGVVDGKITLGTRKGHTEVATQAEEWIADRAAYQDFIIDVYGSGVTPIFEWCSRKNRVVLDHPVARLVLTGGRFTTTGEYLSIEWMRHTAQLGKVEVCEFYEHTTISEVKDAIKGLKGAEGFVLRDCEGNMLKLKAAEYLGLHKGIGILDNEAKLFGAILAGTIDDLMPVIGDEYSEDIHELEDRIFRGFTDLVDAALTYVATYLRTVDEGRGTFARAVQEKVSSGQWIYFMAWSELGKVGYPFVPMTNTLLVDMTRTAVDLQLGSRPLSGGGSEKFLKDLTKTKALLGNKVHWVDRKVVVPTILPPEGCGQHNLSGTEIAAAGEIILEGDAPDGDN